MSSPSRKTVAIAGAAAISASLIGFAALHTAQTSQQAPQTRAVALTSSDGIVGDVFLPVASTFEPTAAEGFPPLESVLQGAESWRLTDGLDMQLDGTDTHTTFGSFVNDDLLVHSAESLHFTTPDSGSEVDLMNFGGGFENEWSELNFGSEQDINDTIITPFGNYTIPLGSTGVEPVASIASSAPADAFSGLEASIQFNTSAAETAFGLARTAFADGEYPLALSQALDGFNNLTVGMTNDLLVNGYIALTGGTEYAEFFFQNPGQPVDLAGAFESAQTFLSQAQGLVTDALGDFGAGNTVSALTDLAGIGTDSTYATDAIILGLFDVLTGAATSA